MRDFYQTPPLLQNQYDDDRVLRSYLHRVLPHEMLAQMEGAPWVADLEPLTPTLPHDLAVTDGGVPASELARITAPVLILGGKNSPGWFQRSVAEQAAATPGAQLRMLDGFDHNAPPEVIAPILIDFFGAHR